MHKSELSDFQLWENVRRNDKWAFDALFDRYWLRLYKTAQGYIDDNEASEEAVHDVFLSIWARREVLQIDHFQNFILTAIRYQIYNRLRMAKRPLILCSEELEFHGKTVKNLGDEKIKENELDNELLYHLSFLPNRCQEIFKMSRIQEFSNDEIADDLGISKRSVENQITLALKHLRIAFRNIASIFL